MIEAEQTDLAAPRRPVKSEAAFRTISEVSEDLDVPQHVLRFWESKFPQIKPLKRGGGRRYYRPEDVQLLRRIRDLLYKDGYTIRGVQKLLRDQGKGGVEVTKADAAPAVAPTQLESPILTQQPVPPPQEALDAEAAWTSAPSSSAKSSSANLFAQAQAAISAAAQQPLASPSVSQTEPPAAPQAAGQGYPAYGRPVARAADHAAAEPIYQAAPLSPSPAGSDATVLASLRASHQRAELVSVLAELEELREVLALARSSNQGYEKK